MQQHWNHEQVFHSVLVLNIPKFYLCFSIFQKFFSFQFLEKLYIHRNISKVHLYYHFHNYWIHIARLRQYYFFSLFRFIFFLLLIFSWLAQNTFWLPVKLSQFLLVIFWFPTLFLIVLLLTIIKLILKLFLLSLISS